jgi:hypothetical protein
MDLKVFVAEARLANRDPGPQSNALAKRLRAESPETIIDLYEQATQRASALFKHWAGRPEPKALFDAHFVAETGNPQEFDPTGPPYLNFRPERAEMSYESWLLAWSFHQVLVGTDPPPADFHFVEHPEHPAIFDFFEGMAGNGLKYAFQDAYERSTETPWPLAPRDADRKFISYTEQLEHAPYRVQLYRATAREVEMDMNASPEWRQWWLSGPLRLLEFDIAESRSLYPGALAMHTGDTPTSTRVRKSGLTVTGTIFPNRDRILETEERDIRQLVVEDMTILLRKVHQKYRFTRELPEAK